MGYEEEIVTALAERLAAEGIGEWSPSGVYGPGPLPAIFYRVVPEISRPVISLSAYPVVRELEPNDSILGVQVRTRSNDRDPRTVDALDDAIQEAFHGLRNLALGGRRVTKILYQSGASLGQDGSNRWGRSANYYVTGPRPERS